MLAETFGARHEDGTPLTPEEVGAAWARRRTRDPQDPTTSEQAATPGTWLGKIAVLIDLLRDWGYTPNLRTEDSGRTVEIEIATCPFLPLAHSHPEVVCGVHRGLLRGTLESLGETDVTVGLQPFVTSTRCLAHLTTATDLTSPVQKEPADD